MELQFLFNSITFSLFIPLLLFILLWKNKKQARNVKLPPGPWKLPFIGSLHHLLLSSSSVPHHSLAKLSKKYGPLMHLQLGEISAVVVSSPEMAKAIMKTHDLAFANRPTLMAADIVFYKCTDISFSPHGDYWRQMRKIFMLELLSVKMVKSFYSILQEELSKLVYWISARTGVTVNLTERINWFTSSVICKAAFGRMLKEKDQEKFIAISKQVLSLAGGFDLADLFPSRKWIHYLCGMKPRLLRYHRELDKIFEGIIEQHQEKLLSSNNNNVEEEEDIVDVILRVMEDGELEFPITRDNIKAIINDIFSAGTDTSATVVIWAMSEMMKRPSVMAKAQAEVRRVLKGKKTFDDKDLENLTYLYLVVKETFRLHPPLAVLLRECVKETRINAEYTIPPKTRVIINVSAIGKDPDYWEDSERFSPERFETNGVDFMGHHYEFLPFGSGRRMCPEISFGLANVTHLLAGLLYHFNWELPSGVNPEDLDMDETMGLVATRKSDLCLIASRPGQYIP